MVDALSMAVKIAGSGLRAQSTRMRIVAENLANVESTGNTPGAEPYARKTITFEGAMNKANLGGEVKIRAIGVDESPFRVELRPGHPAADENGYVKLPNVDPLIEMADLKDANRAYQANLQAIKQARELVAMTLDLLKG
ncbi:MAG: flagellar basal body rod protein FlgC [Beijerinckiaceae bacterium]